MSGATAPRLQLELLCAGLLVALNPNISPADATVPAPIRAPRAPVAVEPKPTSEPRLTNATPAASPSPAATAPPSAAQVTPRTSEGGTARLVTEPVEQRQLESLEHQIPERAVSAQDEPILPSESAPTTAATPVVTSAPAATPAPAVTPEDEVAVELPVVQHGAQLAELQADWASVVAGVPSPVTRGILNSSVGPVELTADSVAIGFQIPQLAERLNDPRQQSIMGQILGEHLGFPVRVSGIVVGDDHATPQGQTLNGQTGSATARSASTTSTRTMTPATAASAESKVVPPGGSAADAVDAAWLAGDSLGVPEVTRPAERQVPEAEPAEAAPRESATSEPERPGSPEPARQQWRAASAASPDEVSPDDEIADPATFSQVALVVQALDGHVIEN